MVWVLGHRGAPRAAPENTIAAFVSACRLGADGVELDVRRTADGALVVHHDARLADGRVIAEVRMAEMPDFVPLLESALDACAGVIVNIEIKNSPIEPGHDPDERTAVGVAELVTNGPSPLRQVVVSSFTVATIDKIKAVEPSVRTGWLVLPGADQQWAIETAVDKGHNAVHPEYRVIDPLLVATAHDAGLALAAWTVDDPDKMRELAEWGVDTIITNEVEAAVAALHS